MKDVNDVAQQGVDLEKLWAAAMLGDAVVGSDMAALADQGLALLKSLAQRVQNAQSKDEAAAYLFEAQSSEATRRVMAAAVHFKRAEALTCLGQMGLKPRGMTPIVRKFEWLLRDEAKHVAIKLEEREDRYQALVLDRLTEKALGLKGFRLPHGYEMDAEGLRVDGEILTRGPIVIAGRKRHVTNGQWWLDLGWAAPGGWVKKTVPRGTVMNARELVGLANDGAPVTSGTTGQVVAFLDAFEKVNEKLLEPVQCIDHMGWVEDGVFMYGRTSLGAPIEFIEEDANRQYVAGITTKGSWEGWCAIVEQHMVTRPLVLLGVYAVCASLLLRVLGQPGFVFEWAGLSSRGKTTAMRAAASVFGYPDVEAPGVIGSWDMRSISAAMYRAAVLQSFPLLLDETKRAKNNPHVLGDLVYAHTEGQDRDRGTVDGKARARRTWRSVLLSTGEAPITSFSKDGGARARALVVRGAPMGDDSEENGLAAERMSAELLEHHGWMGRRFVEWLIANQGKWSWLREKHKQVHHGLASSARDGIVRRLYGYVASMSVAADICHDLGLPGDADEAFRVLCAHLEESSGDSDLPAEAAQAVYRWASGNEDKFWRRMGAANKMPPIGGWIGRWDFGDEWTFIAFNEERLVEMLRTWDYDATGVLEQWWERGWCMADPKGSNRARPRTGPMQSRMLTVRRDAFDV